MEQLCSKKINNGWKRPSTRSIRGIRIVILGEFNEVANRNWRRGVVE